MSGEVGSACEVGGKLPADCYIYKSGASLQSGILTMSLSHQPLTLVEVRPAGGGRGQGLFACADLQAGTVLVQEEPLVQVTVPHTAATLAKFLGQLRSQVRALDEDRQDEFFSLHIARPELSSKDRGDLRMMAVYQTNSLVLRERDKLKGKHLGTAVFPVTSRINHSCRPNCVWSYNAEQGSCEVRSVRLIQAGEEIQANYVEPLSSRADRQKLLTAKVVSKKK